MTQRPEDYYIAHIRQADKRVQTVPEHLDAVQEGCEVFGRKIGAEHLAGMAGLLHDMGKYTPSFKQYIEAVSANASHAPKRGSVDHSTAGGRWLYQRYHKPAVLPEVKATAEWIANGIISHHQGLRDFLAPGAESPFLERVAHKHEGMEEYGNAVEGLLGSWTEEELDCYFADAVRELKALMPHMKRPIDGSLLIKYLFSCLIDADRTNTREFEEDRYEGWQRDERQFFERSYRLLMDELRKMNEGEQLNHSNDSKQAINSLRRDMSEQCDAFASRRSGIYTLSIPTGGGKTLASLRYALKHALEHCKERIVYIVPFTTIIEQNAQEVRRILQDEVHILEHHSNVVEEIDTDAMGKDQKSDYQLQKERLSLARDNWDRPIIFTTMVQFLNTFYAKGTRNVRRLHRLSNAVLIFDEVQAVPPKCVSLFNAALNFLHAFGRSSLILCTATQPALDFVKHKLRMPEQAEIIRDRDEVIQRFKRVELINRITTEGWQTEELAQFVREQASEVGSVLIILNTKSAVRKLYLYLKEADWLEDGGVQLYHLSTGMCAAHRKDTLNKVNAALRDSRPVICLSTQLIEAGVDISFPCVIRSLAGLDSIAQAAGRCNRHGEVELRRVYVIRSAEETLSSLPEIAIGAKVSERLFREYADDPNRFRNSLLSPQAMEQYFRYFYEQIEDDLDYPVPSLGRNLFDLLNFNKAYAEDYVRTHGRMPDIVSRPAFATVEQHFQVIANQTVSVVVPYDEKARELILDLNGELEPEQLGRLLKEAQQYVVNLFEPERIHLDKEGSLFPLLHGHALALQESAYSEEFGVDPTGQAGSGWSFAAV